MAENKTQKTTITVESYINGLDDSRKADCKALAKLMEEATGTKGVMWGPAIAGFGNWHYKYESGRENDWFVCGFSSRKAALTLYIMGDSKRNTELMDKLGKYKMGKGCIYIKTLSDIDTAILKSICKDAVVWCKKNESEQ